MEAITKSEPVYLAAGKKVLARAEAFAAQQKEKYREAIACGRHFPVTVFEAETDDAWARDMAPTFVKKGGSVRAVTGLSMPGAERWMGCMHPGSWMMRLPWISPKEKDISATMRHLLCWRAVPSTVMGKGQSW